MKSKQIHTAGEAIDRMGSVPMLERIEEREPDLAEVVLEELTDLHQVLDHTGLSRPRAAQFAVRLRRLCCTIVLAMRPDVAE